MHGVEKISGRRMGKLVLANGWMPFLVLTWEDVDVPLARLSIRISCPYYLENENILKDDQSTEDSSTPRGPVRPSHNSFHPMGCRSITLKNLPSGSP